ncbi:MAG: tetratricopeptide repeat protein [Bacteroidales bacterium]|nr:tetratricopeptide repeat protein [Bacteroidales bacterium]
MKSRIICMLLSLCLATATGWAEWGAPAGDTMSLPVDSSRLEGYGVLPLADLAADEVADDTADFFSFALDTAEEVLQDSLPPLPTDALHAMLQDMVLRTCHERIEQLLMAGHFEEALALSDSTLELAETPGNYYYQGLVNECMAAWRQAEWAYSKAIRLQADYIDCYLPLIRVLLNLNRPEEAMIWCDRYFDLDGSQSEGLLYRSRVFAMLNEYQEAIADISQVISLDSTNTAAYRLRALYRMETGRYPDAVDDLSQLLRYDPRPEWYALRADCYEAQGLTELALQENERIVEMTDGKQDYGGLHDVAQAQVSALRRRLSMQSQDVVAENVIRFPRVESDSVMLRIEVVSSDENEK